VVKSSAIFDANCSSHRSHLELVPNTDVAAVVLILPGNRQGASQTSLVRMLPVPKWTQQACGWWDQTTVMSLPDLEVCQH
jgi:hypothetical protein